MKKTSTGFKTNIDVLVYTLGLEGVNEEKPITVSDALQKISHALNRSVSSAKKTFYQAVGKDLLVRVADNPAKYCFTKSGRKHFINLKSTGEVLEGAHSTFEDFINKYYFDSFCDTVYNRNPLFEIKYRDLLVGMGLDFVDILREKPDETLKKLNDIIKEMNLPNGEDFYPRVSIVDIGVPDSVPIEEARKKEHVGRLIEVEGRVMQQSAVKPEPVVAAFRCQRCDHVMMIPQRRHGMFIEPYECENDICGRKGPFEFIFEQSENINAQIIYIESERGQEQLAVKLSGSLCAPRWERDAKFVKVVGILRVRKVSKNQTPSFDYILEANSIKLTDDYTIEPPTEDEMKMFDDWAKNPVELRRKLRDAVAPHIYGYEEIKDVLSCAMYADWTWNIDPLKSDTRSSLHVLLIGDPGVAKSQLIRGAIRLFPGGVEAQGESSTGAGLSNAAVHDENGGWSIRAGAFAKADKGLIGFDELDKLGEEGLNKLYSVLERQIQIVNKAGIHAEFPTRCVCLAAANPKKGHLDKYTPIIDQLGVRPAFFQRFDIAFAMMDEPDLEKDGKIFDRIFETERSAGVEVNDRQREIPVELYQKYVLYARSKPKPILSDEVHKHLKEYYLNARNGNRGSSGSDCPTLSARMGQGLIKLATVIARREMAVEVTREHAEIAVELYTKSVVSLGLGNELDFRVVVDGITHDQRTRIALIRDCLIENGKGGVTMDTIGEATGYALDEVRHTLKYLKEKGDVVEVKNGWYRSVR